MFLALFSSFMLAAFYFALSNQSKNHTATLHAPISDEARKNISTTVPPILPGHEARKDGSITPAPVSPAQEIRKGIPTTVSPISPCHQACKDNSVTLAPTSPNDEVRNNDLLTPPASPTHEVRKHNSTTIPPVSPSDEDCSTMDKVSAVLDGTTLNELLSKDESRLLDTIDELRSQGVGRLLGEAGLPQVIVCGDQSSGKSSLLEALTRVRFPTKSSVCTTFATELRLRRDSKFRISCRIKAAASRSLEDKQRFAKFQASFETSDKLPDLVAAARDCMSNDPTSKESTFFDDVLEVEILGPKLAPMTIVDLPGIFHYRSNASADRDINLVTTLVQSYMRQSNSIILAVVSGANDLNNQIIMNHIRKTVPNGSRTLGIITKPDELPSGSAKEQEYLDHARMNPDKFHYGWHVVRNRSYEERDSTMDERDRAEKEFFDNSNWLELPRREVGLGIDSLRRKISKILLDHIATTLPSITQRLERDLEQSRSELLKLGNDRSSPEEQQKYLSKISEKFVVIAKEALEGQYQRQSFFGDPRQAEGLEKRLRAKVRHLSDGFAYTMLERGHKWHIVADERFKSDESGLPGRPTVISRAEFVRKQVDLIAHNERSTELPGVPNPMLVGSLFRQQSEPWGAIATGYVNDVWKAVKIFLEHLVCDLADQRTSTQILIHIIDTVMEIRRNGLAEKLEELLTPHRDYPPFSIDPSFSGKIHASKNREAAEVVHDSMRKHLEETGETGVVPSVDAITAKMSAKDAKSEDKYGSNWLLDFMQAYYEKTLLIFTENVATLAVEQCLLADLHHIFSSSIIQDMTNEKLELIAGESEDTVTERRRLRERVKALQKGLRTIKELQPREARTQVYQNLNRSPTQYSVYQTTPRPKTYSTGQARESYSDSREPTTVSTPKKENVIPPLLSSSTEKDTKPGTALSPSTLSPKYSMSSTATPKAKVNPISLFSAPTSKSKSLELGSGSTLTKDHGQHELEDTTSSTAPTSTGRSSSSGSSNTTGDIGLTNQGKSSTTMGGKTTDSIGSINTGSATTKSTSTESSNLVVGGNTKGRNITNNTGSSNMRSYSSVADGNTTGSTRSARESNSGPSAGSNTTSRTGLTGSGEDNSARGANTTDRTGSSYTSGGQFTGGLFAGGNTKGGFGSTNQGSTSLFSSPSKGSTSGSGSTSKESTFLFNSIDKGGTTLFASTGKGGTSLFGSGSTNGGGFGSVNNATNAWGIFGGPGASRSSSEPNNGTASVPFSAVKEKDTTGQQHFQAITFQDPYRNYSFEELRLVDYSQGRRYGVQNG